MDQTKCWMHRKGKLCWEFTWDDEFKAFMHTTRKGTTYRIFMDNDQYKPVWIGRKFRDGNRDVWCTYERTIGATKIEFEDGSEFHFAQ